MPERLFQILFGKRIAEVHNTRNQPATALADIYFQRFIHLSLAALASELCNIAMQFSQQLRPNPRPQVEVFHILRDEEFQFTQILKLDNRSMTGIRLSRSEGPGFWRKPFVLPCPDAIRSSKLGQA